MSARALPAALALAGLWIAAPVSAQPYPAKPIRVIVAFAPSGIADFAARSVSQKLSESLGVPVIVENRPGAGGITGAEVVAKSPPDGYTLLVTSISHTINPSVRKNLPFDAVRDFAPVTLITDAPNFLVVHPSLPVKSVKELIALARGRPGQITYASSGAGTSTHLSGELFKSLARIDIVHVPYKGGGPAVIDLVGGHVQMMFSTLPSVLQQVRAGKLRGLAVTGARRFPAAQEFPDHDRGRRRGFRSKRLERDVRAGRRAARGRQPARRRDREDPARAGIERALLRPGRRAGRQYARGICRFRTVGNREVEESRRGERDASRLVGEASLKGLS